MSDIHGRADLLEQMFAVIDRDLAGTTNIRPLHVYLGDYIDRGPETRETIELLIDRARRHESVFLKGNHEIMLCEVARNEAAFDSWCEFGGLQTLVSYGLRPSRRPEFPEQKELVREMVDKIPTMHWHFFQMLRPYFVCGDFFFAHAGVRPGVPLNQQKEDDLCWIRAEFLESTENFGKYIVHGHSPVISPDIRRNRINIDTGAYATGNLTLLTIQGGRLLAV